MLMHIIDWFQYNYDWLISAFIQGVIAYHLFFLSLRISKRARLEHKERIKEKAEQLLTKIHREGINSEVYLVNINRYFKDYPENTEKGLSGYSHIKAEIKATRFNGIEFFCSTPEQVYISTTGLLTFKNTGKEAFKVFPVGLVPYEWIEHIDIDGDEYAFVPLFYCKYKGRIYWKPNWRRYLPFGYPYKKLIYYRESAVYREGSDPKGMKWRLVEQPILRK